MKQIDGASPVISRRSLLAWSVLGLGGCGGGAGGINIAGSPGTVGTGLYSQGTITGFGSVIVNAVRFDDTAASVQVDGLPASSQDLRLGMVVDVEGERGADTTLGVATKIEAWSIALGQISQVQSGQFTVAGMRVQTSASTVFDGVSSAAALVSGMTVSVWGLQSGADGSSWLATRVALASIAGLVSSGVVRAGPAVNGLLMTGAKAGSLVTGQLVRVQCSYTSTGNWQVENVRPLGGTSGATQHDGQVEIEGLVTAVMSVGHFMLGSTEVDASSAAADFNLASLRVGQRVEVDGAWVGAVLKASTLELEDEQVLDQAEIKARIEQFTSVSNFVIRGQRCDASNAIFSKGTAGDLKAGVKVKLTGAMAGDVLRVSTVEFDD